MCPPLTKLIKSTLQRKAFRIKLELPIQINRAPRLNVASPAAAILSELSVTGGVILIDHQLGEPGEAVAISFTMSAQCAPATELALDTAIQSVRRVGVDESASLFAHGVQFGQMSDADRANLQNFIYSYAATTV